MTCVGGTEFVDTLNPDQYWSSRGAALSYIPEGAWNEPLDDQGNTRAAASGGGVSSYIGIPWWQTGAGVPSARAGRYTPDLSFSASLHDCYFLCLAASGASCVANSTGSIPFSCYGGTSASAPDMAGIAALLNEEKGIQGNLNSALYQLAADNSDTQVFHEVTVASSGVSSCSIGTPSMCNNSTPSPTGLTGGLAGYMLGTSGYSEVTGLGSIDVGNLLANWSVGGTVTTNLTPVITRLSPSVVKAGTSFTLTVYGANFEPGATVLWNGSSLPATLRGNALTATVPAGYVATVGVVPVTVANPTNLGGEASSQFNIAVDTASGFFTAASTTQTLSFTHGQNASYTVSVTGAPSGATATCLNLPTGASCSSYSNGGVMIATSGANTPQGLYTIVLVFTATQQTARLTRAGEGYLAAGFGLSGVPLGFLWMGSGRKKAFRRCLILLLWLVLLLVLANCGGGGTSSQPTTTTQTAQSSLPLTLSVN